jgi:hypothetical protein
VVKLGVEIRSQDNSISDDINVVRPDHILRNFELRIEFLFVGVELECGPKLKQDATSMKNFGGENRKTNLPCPSQWENMSNFQPLEVVTARTCRRWLPRHTAPQIPTADLVAYFLPLKMCLNSVLNMTMRPSHSFNFRIIATGTGSLGSRRFPRCNDGNVRVERSERY